MPLDASLPDGSVLYLKSGSPPLVVEDIPRADGFVRVVWFYRGEVRRDEFHRDALTAHKPD